MKSERLEERVSLRVDRPHLLCCLLLHFILIYLINIFKFIKMFENSKTCDLLTLRHMRKHALLTDNIILGFVIIQLQDRISYLPYDLSINIIKYIILLFNVPFSGRKSNM